MEARIYLLPFLDSYDQVGSRRVLSYQGDLRTPPIASWRNCCVTHNFLRQKTGTVSIPLNCDFEGSLLS